jgi:hypothetical protein
MKPDLMAALKAARAAHLEAAAAEEAAAETHREAIARCRAAETAEQIAEARLELSGYPVTVHDLVLRLPASLSDAEIKALKAAGLLKRVSARADLSSRPGDRLSHLGWSAAAERIRGALLPRRGAQ